MHSEKELLIHESIINRFDLSFVDKFIELQSKNKGNKQLERECSYWIATIYAENQLTTEAVEIFLQLLKKKKKMLGQFPNILIHTVKLLTQLGRLQDALNLFKEHIHTEELSSFSYSIPLLSWYVEKFDPQESDLVEYRYLYDKARKELGFNSKRHGLKQQILDISNANTNANRRYSEILTSSKAKSKKEKIEVVEEYISSNPPGFYKDLARNMLSKIKE